MINFLQFTKSHSTPLCEKRNLLFQNRSVDDKIAIALVVLPEELYVTWR